MKILLCVLWITGILAKEYPPFNGVYNNPSNPTAGAADTPLARTLRTQYEDGVYAPSGRDRPDPRQLSTGIFSGADGLPSVDEKTVLFAYFGSFVMHEISDLERPGCPPEYFNIAVPPGDPSFDPLNSSTTREIPYQRSRYDAQNTGYSPNRARNQINEVTSFLDLGSVYGNSKAWAGVLRLRQSTCPDRTSGSNPFAGQNVTDCRGELRSLYDGGKYPSRNTQGLPLFNPATPRDNQVKSAERFYQIGGRFGNENPFLLALNVMWFRHHNWLATKVRELRISWSDDQVFNEARMQNIATFQNIVLYEWLPKLLANCSTSFTGLSQDIPNYSGYVSSTPVGLTAIFQGAAKHYIDTFLPAGVYRRGNYNSSFSGCEFRNTTIVTSQSEQDAGKPGLRTCNTYWNSNEALEETDIDEILLGMASQVAEKEDHVINSDLLNSFYGSLQFSRQDLAARTIQHGRDLGLPDYNSARAQMGFPAVTSFNNINPTLFAGDSALLTKLRDLHADQLWRLDIFTGGLLEAKGDGRPGEMFCKAFRDQFIRLRDGDRFWFENTNQSPVDDVSAIKVTTIRDVILRTNPHLNSSSDIQEEPFMWNATGDTKLFCPQPRQLTGSEMEPCTELKTYDNFTVSRVSYALTFALIGVFIILALVALNRLGAMKRLNFERQKKRIATKRKSVNQQRGDNTALASEVLGETNVQQVQLSFGPGPVITCKSAVGGKDRRKFYLADDMKLVLSSNGGKSYVYVRAKKNAYDLVLQFIDEEERQDFLTHLSTLIEASGLPWKPTYTSEGHLLAEASTKEARDAILQSFFKTALAQAMSMDLDLEEESTPTTKAEASNLVNVTLTKQEFAEYLQLKPDSLFVEQMFSVADSDDDGGVSFREFLNIMVLFAKGSPQDKAKLLFDMYDLEKQGTMSVDNFKVMLRSMMEISNAKVDLDQIDDLVTEMMSRYGNKKFLNLEDFLHMMSDYQGELSEASLAFPGGEKIPRLSPTPTPSPPQEASPEKPNTPMSPNSRQRYARRKGTTKLSRARGASAKIYGSPIREKPLQRRVTVRVTEVKAQPTRKGQGKFEKWLTALKRFASYNRNHIFCVSIYMLLTAGVFANAFYAVASNDSSGLRRIGGLWMATARASAAALAFNFSTILLTMCRNTITFLRETFLHLYIPFDSAITMHRIIAWTACFFTGLHVVAHGINFYSISTQSASDLLCLFRDMWFPSNFLPSFHFWAFQTITGITGVILTLIIIVMYIFASPYARRLIFNWFQWTHMFGYIFIYVFSVMHGSGMLISSPSFYYYFLGFATLYTLDRLYSISRKKAEISVVKAELLPSNVTNLIFKRPSNFDYKAGQWVRIACLAQSKSEYHPFTLSSAPHEENLSLHIRAVGPWTTNLRSIYDPETLRDSPYPKLFLDGPFGEGHQDWYRYDVAVLVGGGIGVTPFASILKDLVNTTATGVGVRCKTVYFIWVTRDQKQYEWLAEIIREVEQKDREQVLNTHIFITQLPHKFDLRTTMLYICEKHFQKIAGKSLFTGLRATTHFGRPDFHDFFTSLSQEHSQVENFGVFSCGPPPMTRGVDKACAKLNKYEGATFSHHFENF